eukprot:TRINITY_DN34049_c0_g1_i1.p2 TRINITY_DN34049_c0_g1~~TRINITY_DN34049_c0_g1_i1.p2  ORF type:complete len:118 (+),score=23.60 TRINITY_DN34049_c0_g1_i1:47-400(+)
MADDGEQDSWVWDLVTYPAQACGCYAGHRPAESSGERILYLAKGADGGLGVTYRGRVVTGVAEGSPAERGGLRPGQHILSVAGVPVEHITQQVHDAFAAAPGDRTFCVVVSEQPEQP